ncbi:hypothetical protein SAMD00019534_090610 [Acytostelium subglobosum LB1]|uniref:hypothetical protein n=1 Tax=Acytostelium subglobosum LB1 TaxID=1410327 RepID=UPI0006448F39|nr:hypothetical protein SAMD00019534_090610 [Acytostelium subglobosum LB1]GAM25886.1 hypothetical protein SAMD00019534_090610 [Acytostelium subglobosum LB1]|eukprot:XP_012750929.1 hypothetical protein SAMD00019534_090610 [Acytostelium subglobosum LB1]
MSIRRKKDRFDYLFKLLLIGDQNSSVLIRFSDDYFSNKYLTTIGVDFKIRTIELEGKKIKLQIWDTAGCDRFKAITKSYYRGSMGIVLVYDVTCKTSFENIRLWIKEIETNTTPGVSKILIGNKCDLNDEKVIESSKGMELAKEFGMKFFETSAKCGINVEETFMTLATEVKETLFSDADSEMVQACDETDAPVTIETTMSKTPEQKSAYNVIYGQHLHNVPINKPCNPNDVVNKMMVLFG